MPTTVYDDEKTDGLGDIDQYQRVACKALGVPFYKELDKNKIYHHLGSFDINASTEAIDAVVQTYHSLRQPRNYIFSNAEYLDALKRRGRIESQIKSIEKHRQNEAARYEEYSHKHDEWSEKDWEKRGAAPRWIEKPEPNSPPERDLEFILHFDFNAFTPNIEGYLAYLTSVALDLYASVLLPSIPLYLEENPDRPHGYILGTPGSGKSELLKILTTHLRR